MAKFGFDCRTHLPDNVIGLTGIGIYVCIREAMQRTQHINLAEGSEAVIAKKKSLIMLVCALMIVSSLAFDTIAYLTDCAGVTNRFIIGNVDTVVDETEVAEDGKLIYPDGTPLNPDGTPVDPNVKLERTEEENEYPASTVASTSKSRS